MKTSYSLNIHAVFTTGWFDMFVAEPGTLSALGFAVVVLCKYKWQSYSDLHQNNVSAHLKCIKICMFCLLDVVCCLEYVTSIPENAVCQFTI